jgi:hypothetical protein
MQKKLLLLLLLAATLSSIAQPYIDPINLRYTNAFSNAGKNGTPFTHLYIGSDLPFKIKHDKYIVVSPFFEQWNIDSFFNKNYLPQVSTIALAVSALLPLHKTNWSLTVTAIPRFNSEDLKLQNSFQIGGVLLAAFKKNLHLKYKFGVYVNNDFFGVFVMPLIGIDWNINERNNLFGILPGRLSFEHKINAHLYAGATFRAITNSFRLNNGNYLRIDDNQLGGYLDYYATKHIVFTAEAGAGIFRTLRLGREHNTRYISDYNWGDGMFIKLCTSYRIRL